MKFMFSEEYRTCQRIGSFMLLLSQVEQVLGDDLPVHRMAAFTPLEEIFNRHDGLQCKHFPANKNCLVRFYFDENIQYNQLDYS